MKNTTALKMATAFAILAALAQVGTAQTINQRLRDQNHRIDAGYRDRQLNKYQSARLHADDRLIHAEEHYDRLRDHGRLTAREHASLERQLNRNSGRIWRDRHDRG